MNTDTDHSDLAPPDQAIAIGADYDDNSLDLGGVTIHGNKEERKALFADLAKAQAGYKSIERSRTVTVRPKDPSKPSYTFDYAPLENVLAATTPALNGSGLALLNAVSDTKDGKDLHTLLTHSAGALLHMTMRMPGVATPQDLGAQITYARRYSIQCVTGTSPEFDDDGNEGSGNKVEAMRDKSPQKQRQAPDPKPPGVSNQPDKASSRFAEPPVNGHRSEPPQPLKKPEPPLEEATARFMGSVTGENTANMITEDQGNAIASEFKRLGWPRMKCGEHAKKLTGMTSQTMTKAAADVLLFDLKNREA